MRRFFFLFIFVILLVFIGIFTNNVYAEEGAGCTWNIIELKWVCQNDPDDPTPVCFLPGTIIRSQIEDKKIEDIKVGDTVTSFSDDKIVESLVSSIYKFQRDSYYSLVAVGNYKVKASAEHPFYIGHGEYKEIQKLKPGEIIYVLERDKLTPKFIISNVRINEPTDVYNLTVDNTNTFFANDFAVHNKACTGCGCWCKCGFTGGGDRSCGKSCCAKCYVTPYAPSCVCSHPVNAPSPNEQCLWGELRVPNYEPGAKLPTGFAGPRCWSLEKIRDWGGIGVVWTDWVTEGCPTICTGQGVHEHCNVKTYWTYAMKCIPDPDYVPCTICEAEDPTAVTLVSPSDGETVSSTTVDLSWNPPSDWGTGCSGESHYDLYVRIPPATDWQLIYSDLSSETLSAYFYGNTGVTYEWYVQVSNGTETANSETWSFTIISESEAWWATVDSDVAAKGSLNSNIPSTDDVYLNYIGLGGYPGVAAYGTSTNLSTDNVSEKGWLVNSSLTGIRNYSYDYFDNQVPDSVVFNTITSGSIPGSDFESGGVADDEGYYWYKYSGASGDLIITSEMNLGDRKVILLVESASLNINGNINLTDGEGFFLTIVDGSIDISSEVNYLEGMYFADTNIIDGTGDISLGVRGAVSGNTGINLQRDLGILNGSTPAEVFEYAPDQVLLFPKAFSKRAINWKEVAP